MKSTLIALCFLLVFASCSKPKDINISFVDEFTIPDSTYFNGNVVGGLSGIDFHDNEYFFIVDDAKNPRVLVAEILYEEDTINQINFKEEISIIDTTSQFLNNTILDLESVFIDKKGNLNLVSEGSINYQRNPSIFSITKESKFVELYELPENMQELNNYRHNAAFESSTRSIDENFFWVATEAPLMNDGEEAQLKKTTSPVRFTKFNTLTRKATKQYVYQLEAVPKEKKGNINLNGITAILELSEDTFLVVERAYQNNYGSYGNTVLLYEAKATEKTSDVLSLQSLKDKEYKPLEKRLLLNFNDIKNELTEGIIDNIEGITFGPKLKNGNRSLLLVSDDNFQVYGKQLNQFIVLEIK